MCQPTWRATTDPGGIILGKNTAMSAAPTRSVAQRITLAFAAGVIALSGLVAVPMVVAPEPAQAAVGGDTYPTSLGSIAQDAVLDPWKFLNRECTSFVAWKLNSTNGVNFTNQYLGSNIWFGNANNWGVAAKAKGILVDNSPAVGSVAWSTAGAAGHVAWVADVLPNNKIVVEEYNFRAKATDERGRYYTRTVDASSFTGFIHIKDLAPAPLTDGSFVRVDGTPDVYRLVGGAAVYVSSWAPFGGAQPTRSISAAAFQALPLTPKDGTYIRAAAGGGVYKMALGAPMHVKSWAGVGGEKPHLNVDDAAISKAGGAGVFSHLRATPANGFLRGAKSGRIFRVLDGRAYYVSSWAPYGGTQPSVDIDDATLDAGERVNNNPWGTIDSTSAAPGNFTVSGWAQDPNNTNAVKVHVYIDNSYLGEWGTGASRPDVDNYFHRGSQFGYAITANAGPGNHKVCTYAINTGLGNTNTELGCRMVNVPA